MLDIYNKLPQKTKYIIDIGASWCIPTDPCYPFITNNEFTGLCIEGNPSCIPSLRKNTSKNFTIYNGYVTPDNILQIFEYYNVPKVFDLLKIDIDGYDLEVLRKILSVYKPSIIIAEINEKIPPPIKFEVLYRNNYQWDESHCFGFSISSGELVMKEHNYVITQIFDLSNIIAVNQAIFHDVAYDDIVKIYTRDYINNSERFTKLPWNDNVNFWLIIDNPEVLKNKIQDYFTTKNERSKFLVKTKIKDVDFLIYI